MPKSWFKLNKWKTGWVPASWQGWILSIAYLLFTIYNFFRISQSTSSISEFLFSFIPQTIVFTGLFSVLCYFTSDTNSNSNLME